MTAQPKKTRQTIDAITSRVLGSTESSVNDTLEMFRDVELNPTHPKVKNISEEIQLLFDLVFSNVLRCKRRLVVHKICNIPHVLFYTSKGHGNENVLVGVYSKNDLANACRLMSRAASGNNFSSLYITNAYLAWSLIKTIKKYSTFIEPNQITINSIELAAESLVDYRKNLESPVPKSLDILDQEPDTPTTPETDSNYAFATYVISRQDRPRFEMLMDAAGFKYQFVE